MLLTHMQVPLLRWLVPRQRRCTQAMQIVNTTLDQLISKCKRLVSRLALQSNPSVLLSNDQLGALIGHRQSAASSAFSLHRRQPVAAAIGACSRRKVGVAFLASCAG